MTTNRDLSHSGGEMDRADPDDLRGAEMSGQTPSSGITANGRWSRSGCDTRWNGLRLEAKRG